MLQTPTSQLRVFYIPTNAGFPYNPGIEEAVIRGLKSVTPHVRVAATGGPEPLLNQISRFHPDIVFTLLIGLGPDQFTLMAIRKAGFPIAAWATEDPYSSDITVARGREYNYVFTVESGAVERYRIAGCPQAWHVPLGYDPEIYHPGNVPPTHQSDICFVGVAFDNRLKLVAQLKDYLLQKRTLIVGTDWNLLPCYGEMSHLIRNRIVPPSEARLYYSGAKIVLNIHRRANDDRINANRYRVEARSPNVRTFEICACGSLQLTDLRPDLAKWYAVGRDLDVFSDATNLEHKLDYYLKNEDLRCQIAASGREKTKLHTYRERLSTILRLIKDNPSPPRVVYNARLATWMQFTHSVNR